MGDADDTSYSPDVEICENGRLVYARDIDEGEVISIPSHMLPHMVPISLAPAVDGYSLLLRRRDP